MYDYKNDESIKNVINRRETVWINPYKLPFETVDGLSQLAVSDADIADASARLARFAPFIKRCFPETLMTDGLIESPLREIDGMKKALERYGNCKIDGRLYDFMRLLDKSEGITVKPSGCAAFAGGGRFCKIRL